MNARYYSFFNIAFKTLTSDNVHIQAICRIKSCMEKIKSWKVKKKRFSSVAILAQSRLSLITERSNAYSFIHVLSIGHDFLLLMSA